MKEEFENNEKIINLSKEDVAKIQNLVRKVREVIEWDLGKFCSDTKEIDMIRSAKDAMREIEILFHIPETKFWTEFPSENMNDSIILAEKYNNKILPEENIILNQNDLEKLKVNLNIMKEVINWDIGANDETEINMISEARESLRELETIIP